MGLKPIFKLTILLYWQISCFYALWDSIYGAASVCQKQPSALFVYHSILSSHQFCGGRPSDYSHFLDKEIGSHNLKIAPILAMILTSGNKLTCASERSRKPQGVWGPILDTTSPNLNGDRSGSRNLCFRGTPNYSQLQPALESTHQANWLLHFPD